ncbi:unnamed protein product [Urochloa humidicola]
MEEFQEADVLWPDAAHPHHACHRHGTQPHHAAARPEPHLRLQPSAPVRIPAVMQPEARGGYGDEDDYYGVAVRRASMGTEAGTTIVPPHVLVAARRCAEERRVASSSVCVGHGRTLKGRDLRAVRNAVLHMTGFLSGSDKY